MGAGVEERTEQRSSYGEPDFPFPHDALELHLMETQRLSNKLCQVFTLNVQAT